MNATILLGLALGVGAPRLKDKEAPASLVGEWAVETATVTGQPPLPDLHWRFRFTPDGKWLILGDGKVLGGGVGGYTVKPAASPRAVDLFHNRSDPNDLPTKAIFRIDGDTLILCWLQDSQSRPTRFEGTADAPVAVWVLSRVRDKE